MDGFQLRASSALMTGPYLGCPVFFSYCSDDHRELHSFPTRRSSDLARAGGAREKGLDRARRVQPGPDRRDRRDRKSTRLNSSHMSISYAVFCLKKKKQVVSLCVSYLTCRP